MDTPQTPTTPSTTPPFVPKPPAAAPANPLFADVRATETMKWSASANAISNVIDVIVGYMAFFFAGGILGQIMGKFGQALSDFPIMQIFSQAVWGAIYGGVIGFILSKFYPQIKEANKKYLGDRLNTFFKLLFYPALVGNLFFFLTTSFIGFALGFMPLIIMCAGFVLSSYVYAKMLTKKVGMLYDKPV